MLGAPGRLIGWGLSHVAELLDAAAILVGWALLTWGLASLVGVWQIWPLAGGLLVLSIVGWRHLGWLFGEGLYPLTRERE